MLRTPWIRPVVEEKLREVIRWKSVDAPDRTRDGYQIIGDSVWVKMGGASPLQIIEVSFVRFLYRLCLAGGTLRFRTSLTYGVALVKDI
jgi:hypothetical protein